MQKQEQQDPDMVKLAQHRLDYANYRAQKLIETGAFDLAELGASSYHPDGSGCARITSSITRYA